MILLRASTYLNPALAWKTNWHRYRTKLYHCPWAHPSPHPKRHLDWFSRLVQLMVVTDGHTDRHTDKQTHAQLTLDLYQ